MNRWYVVLCEDVQAFTFIRRVLIETGANARNISKVPYPDNRFHAHGAGSPRQVEGYMVYACGSQHVQMNFPSELKAIRAQHAKRKAALVVHTDVDNATAGGTTVQQRRSKLDAECATAKVPPTTAADPVAFLIARREVETWIHFLTSGTTVNEHTQYPKLHGCEADCQPAAAAFADYARAPSTIPGQVPPSLSIAIQQLAGVI
jgi:hypothetical protein